MSMQKHPEQSQVRAELAAIKRQKIISAASEMFSRYGYANTRLDTVADQLGVTKQFIYSEFDSKAQLLAEICMRAVTSTLTATDGVCESNLPPVEKLAEFTRQFVMAICSHQSDVTVYAHERNNVDAVDGERLDFVRHALDKRVMKILEEGLEKGAFHIKNPRITALAIQGMVSWMYVWYRPEGKLSLEELANDVAIQVLSLVEAK